MKIVICSSVKFKKEVEEFARELKWLGVHHIKTPDFSYAPDFGENREQSFYKDQLPFIAKSWINEIRKADLVFFFNKNAYLGINTTLQLGVAIGMDKLIGALEEDEKEPCRNIYFDFIAENPESFVEWIK